MLVDGAVEYQGRRDMQCKVRGHRVQIDEIEKALQGIPQLNQVAVVAQDWRSDKRLIAYVVPQAGRIPKISELRSALAEKLPDFMIPSLFVCVDSMPLMPTGKLDRRALSPPEIRSPRSSSALCCTGTPWSVCWYDCGRRLSPSRKSASKTISSSSEVNPCWPPKSLSKSAGFFQCILLPVHFWRQRQSGTCRTSLWHVKRAPGTPRR